MACLYKLVFEVTTIRVPRVVSVSETCDEPTSCCTPDGIPAAICADGELDFLDDPDMCETAWATSDTTGLDGFNFLDIENQILQLPAGSTIIGTECFTVECDDTPDPDLDCECA